MSEASCLFIVESQKGVYNALAVFHKSLVRIRIHTAGKQSADGLRAAFGVIGAPKSKASGFILLLRQVGNRTVEGFLYLRLFAVRCKGDHTHCGHIHAGDGIVAALFFGFGQDIPAAVLVLVCEQVVHHSLAGVLPIGFFRRQRAVAIAFCQPWHFVVSAVKGDQRPHYAVHPQPLHINKIRKRLNDVISCNIRCIGSRRGHADDHTGILRERFGMQNAVFFFQLFFNIGKVGIPVAVAHVITCMAQAVQDPFAAQRADGRLFDGGIDIVSASFKDSFGFVIRRRLCKTCRAEDHRKSDCKAQQQAEACSLCFVHMRLLLLDTRKPIGKFSR